jgi:hypothetical protein
VRDERADIERERKTRHQMYAGGVYPYGEKQINPQRIEGASEYGKWLGKQPSFSQEQMAHVGMLEHEEKVLKGDRNPVRSMPKQEIQREAAAPPPITPMRTNRTTQSCSVCGQDVGPGAGSIERGPEGYSTKHLFHGGENA